MKNQTKISLKKNVITLKTNKKPENIPILLRISEYVLNHKSEDIRNDIHKYLILLSLRNEKNPLNKYEITQKIENDLFVKKFPTTIIDQSLTSLVNEGLIKEAQTPMGSTYSIEPKTSSNVSEYHKKLESEVYHVNKLLVDYFISEYGNLSKKDIKQIQKKFHKHIGSIFYDRGVDAAQAVFKDKSFISKPDLEFNLDVLSEGVILEELDHITDKFQVKNFNLDDLTEDFNNFLFIYSDKLTDYLYTLSISYFFIQILHLDPECQSLSKKMLSNKVLYLDTNILIYLFIEHSEKSDSIREVVRLSRSLGISLRYTSLTKEEYMRKIESWQNEYSNKPVPPLQRFLKAKSRVKGELLNDFYYKKELNPKINWRGYFDRLKLIDSLAEKEGIILEDVSEHPLLIVIQNETNESQIEDKLIKQNLKDFHRYSYAISEITPWKYPNVNTHDAFHFCFINETRENSKRYDILGPHEWFLTIDTSLERVERILKKNVKKSIPSTIQVSVWLKIISPILAPTMKSGSLEATFAKLFSSTLPVTRYMIPDLDFVITAGSWMDTQGLSADDIAEIVGSKYIQDILELEKEDPGSITQDILNTKIQESIVSLRLEWKQERKSIRDATNQQFAEMQQQIKLLESELGQQKMVTQQQTSIKNVERSAKTRWKVSFVIIGLFTLVVIIGINKLLLDSFLANSDIIDPWSAFSTIINLQALLLFTFTTIFGWIFRDSIKSRLQRKE